MCFFCSPLKKYQKKSHHWKHLWCTLGYVATVCRNWFIHPEWSRPDNPIYSFLPRKWTAMGIHPLMTLKQDHLHLEKNGLKIWPHFIDLDFIRQHQLIDTQRRPLSQAEQGGERGRLFLRFVLWHAWHSSWLKCGPAVGAPLHNRQMFVGRGES